MKKRGPKPRPLTHAEFRRLVHLIVTGQTVKAAAKQIRRCPAFIRRQFRQRPEWREQWRYVVKWGSRRRGWPSVLQMDEVLDTLVGNPGMSVREACERRGVGYHGFLKQSKTPDWEPQYLRCKSLQRDLAFEALSDKIDAPGITRSTIKELNQAMNALRRLEPIRLRPKRGLRRPRRITQQGSKHDDQ